MTPDSEPTSEAVGTADKPTLHVVFNAAELGRALSVLGRSERVIGFPDNLSFGPIDPPSAALRQGWIEDKLGYEFKGIVQEVDLFWAEVTSPDVLPVVWVSRCDAQEYAGFLEFVWRIGDAPFRVIDVTMLEYANLRGEPILARSLGVIPAHAIVAAGLPDRQTTLSRRAIEAYRETWRSLKRDNAPLRVVDETGLVSAPIDFFDNRIVSRATEDWQSGARVVGEAMVSISEGPFGHQISDLVLFARVGALGETGVLEIEGDRSDMRETRVRRSQPARF